MATIYHHISRSIHFFLSNHTYLTGAGNNAWKLILAQALPLDDGLHDGWMVRSQIDKDMANTRLPDGLEEGLRCSVSHARQEI